MGDQDAPPFASVAIAGVGLIGGSIALGIRERWPSVRVYGVDRPAVLAHAAGSGALDKGLSSVAELPAVDLVILAAPVRQNARLLTELPGHVRASAIVSDVGGTKRDIQKAAAVVGDPLRFVGGHPIGGAEHGGFGFARPDLFRGRPWIFTPIAENAEAAEAIDRLERLAEGLGARPVRMDAAEHDRVMAFVSHLPQLATSALMEVIGGAVQGEGLRVAGRGLVDTTRLASSPASVWKDVCVANADTIRTALDLLIDRLGDLRADLGRGEVMETIFADAAKWRGELTKIRE
jgi:prephenate dehydrogenase